MPRWPLGYKAGQKQKCKCGKKKDFYAALCRKCTVPGKPLSGKKGHNHPAWKGGRILDKDGYIKTYDPSHPWPRRGGYVREHDRIMELAIGRRILPSEVVHHIDENKLNNVIENLQLLQHDEHSKMHMKKNKHLYLRDLITGRYVGKEVQYAG